MCTLTCRKMCVDSLAQKWDRIILGSAQQHNKNKLSKLLTLIAVTCRLWWISINNSTLLDPLTGLIRLIRSEKKSRGNFSFYFFLSTFISFHFQREIHVWNWNSMEPKNVLNSLRATSSDILSSRLRSHRSEMNFTFFSTLFSLLYQALCGWSRAQMPAEFSGEKGFVFHIFISFRHRGIQSSL